MPDDRPILPTADAVITPVLEKLYELRPTSFQHLNLRSGVYWHPVLGFRAQLALMLRRLALLASERRLDTAEGTALLEYCASEFDAVPDIGQTKAQGHVTLGRDGLQPLPAGDYPKGTRISRSTFVKNGVTFASAEYETLVDVHFDANSTAAVTVPIQATRAGTDGNTPIDAAGGAFNVTLPGLVPNVSVTDFQAAGGSNGPDDTFVRLFARAYALGQYGPTASASKLGALSGTGVRHFLVYDNVARGTQTILVADESWASSDRWARGVQQSLIDNDLVGFGCKVAVGSLRNRVISVTATVVLRDSNYLHETTEIDLAIQESLRSYFDDRPSWNAWNTNSAKSAVSHAHAKIFSCQSLTVNDAATGAPIAEILNPDYTQEQFHYLLANNAVKLTYLGPS
jgi:hypothetical protein